jgi:predicted nucleic acid-binding protein
MPAKSNPRIVADAWALIAFLQQEEPAAARVKSVVESAERGQCELFVSVINLGEVYYIVGRSKGIPEADSVIEDLEQLSLKVIPADRSAVLRAASLKAVHRLSYADAFAMAAALALDATVMTGDPELIALAEHVRVEALQREKPRKTKTG